MRSKNSVKRNFRWGLGYSVISGIIGFYTDTMFHVLGGFDNMEFSMFPETHYFFFTFLIAGFIYGFFRKK